MESNDKIDRDIFAYSSRDGYLSLAFLIYRNGLLLGKETHIVERFFLEEDQVVDLITQLYSRLPEPKERYALLSLSEYEGGVRYSVFLSTN